MMYIRSFSWIVMLSALLVFAPLAQAQGLDFMTMTDSLPNVQFGDAAWADFDADGDLDMAISGSSGDTRNPGAIATFLFVNLRDTTYRLPMVGIVNQTVYRSPTGESGPRPQTSLAGVWQSSLGWGDYDNDGDVDLATNGLDQSGQIQLRLHENIGDGIRLTERAVLPGTRFGDFDWGDYDNDGDLDLVIIGIDATGQYITRIYENRTTDTGTFIERDLGLRGLAYSSARWGDYDADGDLDLLTSGVAQPQAFETHVYRNEGNGVFTDLNASFDPLLFSSAAWGDYDSDGDLDIALSGGKISPFFYRGSLRIYRNEGGSFIDLGIDLPGGYQGNVNWGDYDNDGDPDILVSGGTVRNLREFQVVRNEGGGMFTPDASFIGLGFGTSFWGDYDSDGDLDVFGLGQVLNGSPLSHEVRNELASPNTPPTAPEGLQATTGAGITFSWNPASDIETPTAALTYNLRVGSSPGASDVVSPMAQADGTRLLTARGNVGSGLSWSLELPPGEYYWSVQSIDAGYEGSAFGEEQSINVGSDDGIPPAIPTGFSATGQDEQVFLSWNANAEDDLGGYRLYRSTDGNTFSILTTLSASRSSYIDADVTNSTTYFYRLTAEDFFGNESGFTATQQATPRSLFELFQDTLTDIADGDTDWGDFDNDGDLDLIITGNTLVGRPSPFTRVYRNDDSLFRDMGASLLALGNSAVAWGDYDNDGDLDFANAGSSNFNSSSMHIYRNDAGRFTRLSALSLIGVNGGAIDWGDFDNDGDLDLVLAPRFAAQNTIIYRNEGNDVFSLFNNTLPQSSRASWGDFDTDGSLDLLLFQGIARLYRIDEGSFTQTGINLPAAISQDADLAPGDYDGDGDLDLVMAGVAPDGEARVYRNDNGQFVDTGTRLPNATGDADWGDFDGDGDLDLAINIVSLSAPAVKVYRNDEGVFTEVRADLPTFRRGTVDWGDFNGDGLADLIITGELGSTVATLLYRSNGQSAFSRP